MSEKSKSSTADWLAVLAGVLGLIAAILGAGPSILGYSSPREMTCDLTGLWCKKQPEAAPGESITGS